MINPPLVFSTAFSVEYGQICKIIRKQMPLINLDPELNCAMQSGYKCVARRTPTLRQFLSPILFLSKPTSTPTWLQHKGSYPCSQVHCICYTVMIVSNKVESFSSGRCYPVRQYINCNTTNVIYM